MKLKGHTLLKSKQSSLDTHSNVMHSSKVVVVIDNDKLLYYVNDVKKYFKKTEVMCLYVHQLFQSLWRCCIPFCKSGSHIHSHIHTLWLWYTIRKFTLNAFYYSRWWFLENLHSHIFSYIISHTTSLLYNRKEQKARILLKKICCRLPAFAVIFSSFFFCSICSGNAPVLHVYHFELFVWHIHPTDWMHTQTRMNVNKACMLQSPCLRNKTCTLVSCFLLIHHECAWSVINITVHKKWL